jgi:hypothetical protein
LPGSYWIDGWENLSSGLVPLKSDDFSEQQGLHNSASHHMAFSAARCSFPVPSPIFEARGPPKLPLPELTIDVPHQQYKTVKIAPIPFDPRVSNDGKFTTLADAITFIGRHCMVHHKAFTRNLARLYLPFCRVLDLVHGGLVTPVHLSKRDFDSVFGATARLLCPSRPIAPLEK